MNRDIPDRRIGRTTTALDAALVTVAGRSSDDGRRDGGLHSDDYYCEPRKSRGTNRTIVGE